MPLSHSKITSESYLLFDLDDEGDDFSNVLASLKSFFKANKAPFKEKPIAFIVGMQDNEIQLKRLINFLISMQEQGDIPEGFDIENNICFILGDDSLAKAELKNIHGWEIAQETRAQQRKVNEIFNGLMVRYKEEASILTRESEVETLESKEEKASSELEEKKSERKDSKRLEGYQKVSEKIFHEWLMAVPNSSLLVSISEPPLFLASFVENDENAELLEGAVSDALMYAAFNIRNVYEKIFEQKESEFFKREKEAKRGLIGKYQKLKEQLDAINLADHSPKNLDAFKKVQTQLRNTFVELEQLAEERLKILSRHKNIVNIFKLGSVLSSKKPLGILGNYPLIVELGLDREIRPNSCPQFYQLIKDNEQLPAVVQTMGNSIKAWNVATLNKISRKLKGFLKEVDESILSDIGSAVATINDGFQKMADKVEGMSYEVQTGSVKVASDASQTKVIEATIQCAASILPSLHAINEKIGKNFFQVRMWPAVAEFPNTQRVLGDDMLRWAREGLDDEIRIVSSQSEVGEMFLDERGNLVPLQGERFDPYTDVLRQVLNTNKDLKEKLTIKNAFVYDRFDGTGIDYQFNEKHAQVLTNETRQLVQKRIDAWLCRTQFGPQAILASRLSPIIGRLDDDFAKRTKIFFFRKPHNTKLFFLHTIAETAEEFRLRGEDLVLFLKEAQAYPLVNRHTFGKHSETWNFLQRGIEATEKQQPIDLIEYRGNTWLSLASLDAELKASFQQEQEVKRELTFR
ncbi:hypothetical protein [Coxiella burnetii]|uniref:hypothetical protein n=1 Tax=Coxiella burnetii TaxID=777 RepID=UPI0002DCEA27|nr:hypothetical protein [Coxiella burnetii]ATN85510.1 hypothetical protein AYO29_02920 [Coxiella burnetii str. Schperling]